MVNAETKAVYVKFHWRCQQPKRQLSMADATRIAGEDPDYSKRELYELLEGGGDCRWIMALQVMTPEEASTVEFDPFDPTSAFAPLSTDRAPLTARPQRSGRAPSSR
jgi:catalase